MVNSRKHFKKEDYSIIDLTTLCRDSWNIFPVENEL